MTTYQVIAPLVIVPNDDQTSGDGYFYRDALIPAGWNDERCKQLAAEGMLEKAAAVEEEDSGPNPGTVEYILAEVGDDPAKAQTALDAEREEKGDKARKGLVEKLEAVIAAGGQGA